jgi:predicted nucleotidyltransferase
MPLPGLRDKEVDILRSTFRHFSFVQEVRVFGSRANGIARRSSDLDLAISSPEATPAEWAELQICHVPSRKIIIHDYRQYHRVAHTYRELARIKCTRDGSELIPLAVVK